MYCEASVTLATTPGGADGAGSGSAARTVSGSRTTDRGTRVAMESIRIRRLSRRTRPEIALPALHGYKVRIVVVHTRCQLTFSAFERSVVSLVACAQANG